MRAYSLRRLLWAGPLTTMIAIAVDLLYYLISKAFGEKYLLPLDASGTNLVPMPATLISIVILICGLLATLFFGLLISLARKPAIVFISVMVTALILSFGGSFNLPLATLETRLLLSGMNILAAACLTAGILYFSSPKPAL